MLPPDPTTAAPSVAPIAPSPAEGHHGLTNTEVGFLAGVAVFVGVAAWVICACRNRDRQNDAGNVELGRGTYVPTGYPYAARGGFVARGSGGHGPRY